MFSDRFPLAYLFSPTFSTCEAIFHNFPYHALVEKVEKINTDHLQILAGRNKDMFATKTENIVFGNK